MQSHHLLLSGVSSAPHLTASEVAGICFSPNWNNYGRHFFHGWFSESFVLGLIFPLRTWELVSVSCCNVMTVVAIVIVMFLTPTGCVWRGQQERADSDWTLGEPDGGWHQREHGVRFCGKCFCEQIQPLDLHHQLDEWVFRGCELFIWYHFWSWPLQRPAVGGRGLQMRAGGAGTGSHSWARVWLRSQEQEGAEPQEWLETEGQASLNSNLSVKPLATLCSWVTYQP